MDPTTTRPRSAAGGGYAAAVVVATLWQGKTRQTEPRQGTASEPAEPRQSTPGKVAEPSQATLRVATTTAAAQPPHSRRRRQVGLLDGWKIGLFDDHPVYHPEKNLCPMSPKVGK